MAGEYDFDENAQRAKVAAGFKGGPFYSQPLEHPAMTFIDGVPAEVKEKLGHGQVPTIPVVAGQEPDA